MGWSGRGRSDRTSISGQYGNLWLVLVILLLAGLAWLTFRPGSTAILPDPAPLHGAQPYATLLCKFAGQPAPSGDELKPVSYYDRLMVGTPDSVDEYWRQVSYGAISLEGSKAFGWFDMAKPESAYKRGASGPADLDALARDCTSAAGAAEGRDLYFPNYVGLNLVFSDCADQPRGGAMDLRLDERVRNYRVTWLCPGYASSQQIFAHEIGHSFGLTHSEDSQGVEYGNYWDLMSNTAYCAPTTDLGTLAQEPIAYDKDVLGWIAASAKYTARRSGVETIQLDYLEASRPSSPGFLLAEVPLSGGRFYTIEARSRSGYDAALPAAGVLIHEVDPARENRAQLVQGPPTLGESSLLSAAGGWPVGSVFTDPQSNVGISVDRQVDDGFVVTVYTGALPWPLPSAQQANSDGTTTLQWQATSGAKQYEIQVTRVSQIALAGSQDWGAAFVSDRPVLAAKLPAGQYRWQVRELPSGSWSPPEMVVAGKDPAWQSPEQVAQVEGWLRVAPMVSPSSGGAEVAWATDDHQRTVSVTRAAWQGDSWTVEDLLKVSRRGLALSFTPAGDLKVAWPSSEVDGGPLPISSPAMALDAGGRAHTIWSGANGGVRGIFAAVVDAHAPSAGPAPATTPRVRPVPVAPGAPDAAKYSPALALDANGNGEAVWIDMRDGQSAVYSAEQRQDGSWGPAVRLSQENESVFGRPAIALDAAGNAYAVWEAGVDCGGPAVLGQISFAERPAGGEWQPSIALAAPGSGGRYIDPVVATNEAGEVYVAWGEIKDGNYQLFSAYRSPEQQWESPLVAAVGHTESSDMPLSLAIDARGDAYLTWAESQGGGHTLVRFVATR